MKRPEELGHQAPTDGYQPAVEISMPHDAPRWRPGSEGEYYLKLGNGTYARAQIDMAAGGDHFVSVMSYLNPQPGSRNLEYDSSKQINPR